MCSKTIANYFKHGLASPCYDSAHLGRPCDSEEISANRWRRISNGPTVLAISSVFAVFAEIVANIFTVKNCPGWLGG